MSVIRMPPQMCTYCGYTFEAASMVSGKRRPKPGDISICLNCGEGMLFTAELRLRPITEQELSTLPWVVRQQLFQAKLHCTRARGLDLSRRGGKA